MFIDTHCHLDDQKILDKDNVINECVKNGVNRIINMGCDVDSSIRSCELSNKYDIVYFASGIHPENANQVLEKDYKTIIDLSKKEKCVAIGEIGLDYHWVNDNKDIQKEVFTRQLDIACEINLPVSIHSRDAAFDTVEIIKSYKNRLPRGGVMHCFSGSKETAKIYLDCGFYLGFGGTLTFKSSTNLREVAAYTPFDRILTETDSPYLSPEPKRGQTNMPYFVPFITAKIAEIKDISIEETTIKIKENAYNLFNKLK